MRRRVCVCTLARWRTRVALLRWTPPAPQLLFSECGERGSGDASFADPLGLCAPAHSDAAALQLFLTGVSTFALMVVTFGAALPSGLFIPSLVVGAAFGRMLGTMVRALQHTRAHWQLWSCAR